MIDDPVANAVNHASAAAFNRVYEFASRFGAKKDYLPIERLAEEVQEAIIRTFAARIQDKDEED